MTISSTVFTHKFTYKFVFNAVILLVLCPNSVVPSPFFFLRIQIDFELCLNVSIASSARLLSPLFQWLH